MRNIEPIFITDHWSNDARGIRRRMFWRRLRPFAIIAGGTAIFCGAFAFAFWTVVAR